MKCLESHTREKNSALSGGAAQRRTLSKNGLQAASTAQAKMAEVVQRTEDPLQRDLEDEEEGAI